MRAFDDTPAAPGDGNVGYLLNRWFQNTSHDYAHYNAGSRLFIGRNLMPAFDPVRLGKSRTEDIDRFCELRRRRGRKAKEQRAWWSHSGGGPRQHSVTTMHATDFNAARPRLTAIAVRILGSEADADDVVQETWLRLSRSAGIDDLPAWLTTVVTRLCLDQLRKRRTRSLAEAETSGDPTPVDPEADALLAEQTGDAMQVVLDALAPAERVAFVLHDVFGYPFEEISAVLGRSGTAVRKLASRARRKVQGVAGADVLSVRAPREPPGRRRLPHGGTRRAVSPASCCCSRPTRLCVPTWYGQKLGADPVYDGAAAVADRFNGTRGAVHVTIDGELGAAWIQAGVVKVAFVFHVEAGLVREVEQIANPEVLATMDVVRVRVKS